jgi:hypothetical protein
VTTVNDKSHLTGSPVGNAPGNNASVWFREQPGAPDGPYSLEELRFLRDRGRLGPHDRVRQGSGAWVAARTVIPFNETTAAQPAAAAPRAVTARQPAAPVKFAPAKPAAGKSASVPAVPPPVRPAPAQPTDDDARKKALIGAGIGAGIVLLVLLILLLLSLFAPPGGDGTGLAGGTPGAPGGTGGGSGTGTTEGTGDGTTGAGEASAAGDSASGGGNGTAADIADAADPNPAGASQRTDDAQTTAADQTGRGDPSNEQPAPPISLSITALETATAAPPEAGTGLGLAGSGDGGGSGLGLGGGGDLAFFGVKGKGNKVIYVVDCSGSMSGPPFMRACQELLQSISQLKSRQSFYIVFFSETSYPMYYPNPPETGLVRATDANKTKATQWVQSFGYSGGTDPTDALVRSLGMKPDTIFLLTDGAFTPTAVDAIRQHNPGKKVTINTISFLNRFGEPLLQQIANENNGTYRFVP